MRGFVVLGIASAATAVFLAASARAEETKRLHEVVPVSAGQTIVFSNLAGRVHVTGGSDGAVTIDGTVHAESRELLDAVRLDVAKEKDRSLVHVRYPVDRFSSFHYSDPHQESRFWSSFNFSSSDVEYQGRLVTVTSGRHRGKLLYADVSLRVPKGVSVELENCVGRVDSRDVAGALTISTTSADVSARESGSAVRIRTGSGDVRIRDGRSGVDVTTGSGDVDLAHVAGAVTLRSGSGDMNLADVSGALKAHTGSGTAVLERVDGSLEFESGSGDLRARHLTLEGKLSIETGSGDVELAGDIAKLSGAKIDVSSGTVNWSMSGVPNVDVTVSTSSGSIELDVPGLTFSKRKERRVEASRGGGGVPVRISTSSGDVSIRG